MSNQTKKTYILAIESSCDDTSAAVSCNKLLLSNVVANQQIHTQYGGVVPELASRAHQQNIIPVVHEALKQADIKKEQLDAIAFTRGPGLMGSLLVGTSFAKGLALSLNIPLIEINHLQAHILANFIEEPNIETKHPTFPFMSLLVSGGNSQVIWVKSPSEMEIIGKTIDDAAGEAFDKCAKIMGLPYPGGPYVDKLAKEGKPYAFKLNKSNLEGYDYSFSGLKTSFLYLLRDELKKNPNFVEENKADLCASLQQAIIDTLMGKFMKAVSDYNVNDIALAGGVSANSGLRKAFMDFGLENNKEVFIPKLAFTMDNAAMIAISGYYKYVQNDFCDMALAPFARVSM
jgi:N6-L-threonylcarbamoyladenine synthase